MTRVRGIAATTPASFCMAVTASPLKASGPIPCWRSSAWLLTQLGELGQAASLPSLTPRFEGLVPLNLNMRSSFLATEFSGRAGAVKPRNPRAKFALGHLALEPPNDRPADQRPAGR